jgi:alcohol dehydrogenase
VEDLERRAGITAALGDRGVKRADVGVLAAHAVEDACLVTNPRPANRRDLEVIFEEAL